MGMTQGNQEIGKYFNAQFNGSVYSKMVGGFFSTWAQDSLSNTRAVLVEYPKNTRSIAECINDNYSGRTYDAFMNLLSSEPGNGGSSGTSGSDNGHINSGVKYVNVRQEANTTSTILGQLYGNNPIQILAKVKPYGDSYYWYKIVFIKDGEKLQAYVREDFVTVTGEIPKDDIPSGGGEPSELLDFSVGQVNEKASSVHVRKGPSTATNIVTSVSSGELLDVIGKTQPGGETIPWYRIRWQAGVGFVRSDFILIQGQGIDTGKYGNVTLSNVLDYIFFGVESEVSAYNLAHSNALVEKIEALTVVPLLEAGPFTVTLEVQVEDDCKVPNGNQLQFLNGNLLGVILPNEVNIPSNIFEQKFGADFKQKLNFEYGKPGNGTYFDIQTLLTLWNNGSNIGDSDAILDFEFAWRDDNGKKVPVIMITGELQRIIGTSKEATKYLNALIKIEIDLGKLNIDPASYLFTHDISQYLVDKFDTLNRAMANSNKSKFSNTQNPEKLYEMIKTLCYTFLQVGSTQIIMELKGVNKEVGKRELENIYNGVYDVFSNKEIATTIVVGGSSALVVKIIRILGSIAIFA